MLDWITENLSTIVVSLILVLIVAVIIRKLVRDKKKGKSSCGCNCALRDGGVLPQTGINQNINKSSAA